MTSAVLAEIQRVLPIGSTVDVLGGDSALPVSVDEALDAADYRVDRFAGSNMYDTAVKIDQRMWSKNPSFVMVTTGSSYYDALAAGPDVADFGGVLVLSTGGVSNASLSSVSLAYLNSLTPFDENTGLGTMMITVGGPADNAVQQAIAAGRMPEWAGDTSWVTSLVGANAEETALQLADNFQYGGSDGRGQVGIATASDWHDALAGGATVNTLLLTPPNRLYPDDATFLSQNASTIAEADVFGGTAALSAAIPAELVPLIGSTQAVQDLQVTPGDVPPVLLTYSGIDSQAVPQNIARVRADLRRG